MAPTTLEGQTLGKYRILEPLGRGGMAQVYRAYHPQLDRYVAVKVLRSDLVEEKEFLARFKREAQAVAALRHPNIVQVFDFDTQDDLYFMVMELLEGDTLKAYLNRYRTRGEYIPLGEVTRILLDVLEGLTYAHKEGIIHRDIKPANVLLTRGGRSVVTDFGVAQIIGGTRYTVSGALMGTLNYMSPEQGLEGHGDQRSDLYSLGIVFYEMLTGKTPFDADTPLAILMKHLNDPLPLPRKVNPNIPEAYERVVLKTLAKQPDDRYQNAADMAQALREAAHQAGIIIPESVILTIPGSTPEVAVAPAVYSGAAREQIEDVHFAVDDTDSSLGKKLEAEKTVLKKARIHLDNILSKLAKIKAPEMNIAKIMLIGIGLLIIANLGAVWLTIITGRGEIYGKGWPMELILVGIFFSLVMTATDSLELLIPAGIIISQGMLLSYYSLTGNWWHWVFLWPLEPILVLGTIFGTIWLYRRRDRYPRLAQSLGYALVTLAGVWAMLIAAGVILNIVFNFFVHL
jgi:serine/threonine protein kinase